MKLLLRFLESNMSQILLISSKFILLVQYFCMNFASLLLLISVYSSFGCFFTVIAGLLILELELFALISTTRRQEVMSLH